MPSRNQCRTPLEGGDFGPCTPCAWQQKGGRVSELNTTLVTAVTVSAGPRSAGARKWWALAALTLGVLAVGLDATVLSVALPTLAVSLHASTTDLQWFISAYMLALAAALLPGALLGDRLGRKKVLLGALAVFGLGSLACANSAGAGMFIAARGVRARRGRHDPAGPLGGRGDVHQRGAAGGASVSPHTLRQ
jgi:MFS family permease